MCDFLSVYIGWDGEILCGNMSSHESAESHHKLNKKLASRRPPVPMEWTEDDDGDSISVRVPHDIDDDRNESYYKAIVLADYKTRQNLIVSILESGNYGGSLDLRGCPIESLPDNLSVSGYLDLRGCTGLTSLPDNLSVGGYLDLRGCKKELITSAKAMYKNVIC